MRRKHAKTRGESGEGIARAAPGMHPSTSRETPLLLQLQLTQHPPQEATPSCMADTLSPVPLLTPSFALAVFAPLLETCGLSRAVNDNPIGIRIASLENFRSP